MSEDVSANFRLGVTIVLLAGCISVVLNIFVVMNDILNGFTSSVTYAMGQTEIRELLLLQNSPDVSGALAYKIISLHESSVTELLIEWKTGAVSSDYRDLLLKAGCRVKVNVVELVGETYSVTVKEL